MASRLDWSRPAAPRYASLKAERPHMSLKDPAWVPIAHGCLNGFQKLSANEKRFLESILSRLPSHLSQKQNDWLKAISLKARA